MKAVIPAAGLGTRMLPATKSMPKEMLPVVDRPLIQYAVEEAVASGIEDILIVTGRGKRAIEDHFDRSFELEARLRERGDHAALEQLARISEMANIHYVRQAEPRGLGDAILCARRFVADEPFAVLLGDDIILDDVPATKRLRDVHARTGGPVVCVEEVAAEDVGRYGVVAPAYDGGAARPGAGTGGGGERSEEGADGRAGEGDVLAVRDLVEKPSPEDAPSRLAIVGRYILDASVMDALRRTEPGRGEEVQLTDALAAVARASGIHASRLAGRRLDAGDLDGWLEANMVLSGKLDALGSPSRGVVGKRVRNARTR